MLHGRYVFAMVAFVSVPVGCSHKQQISQSPAPKSEPPRVIVSAGPPRPVPAPPTIESPPLRKQGDAIFFDFDSALVRDDARQVLQKVADTLQTRRAGLRIEGNCDEVGTVEYNLALGEHRAGAAKQYLVHLGVPSEKIATISYGSQRPKDPGHDDTAHAQNRRDDFVLR